MKKWCFFSFALACVFLSCAPDGGNSLKPENFVYAAEAETGFTIPDDLIGLVHTDARVIRQNELMDEYGVTWMLTDFGWGGIQPEAKKDAAPADWNWAGCDSYVSAANARSKKMLAVLDYDVDWLHGGWSNPPEYGTVTDSQSGNPAQVKKYADGCTDMSIGGYGTPEARAAEREKFCAYVKAAVERYDGSHGFGTVDAWCIWNEPNLSPRFWTASPQDFFALTSAAAAAIREAAPDAVVLGGAYMTIVSQEWLPGIFTSGAMANVDYIAYHPYMPAPSASASVFANFKTIVAQQDVLQNAPGKYSEHIWVTEVGYPNTRIGGYGTEIADEKMPEAVIKTITLLTVERAAHIFWYHLRNPQNPADNEPEDWFGLFNYDYSPRPFAPAFKLAARNIPGKTWKTRLPMRSTGLSKYIKAYYFEGDDGERTLIIWNDASAIPRTITVILPGENQQRWDVLTGVPESVAESSTYTLESGLNKSLLFFTWETGDSPGSPAISTR